MPKLQLLAPCDKVIISEEAGASVISILESLTVGLASGEEQPNIPADTAIPMKWTVFTLWLAEKRDAKKKYEQLIQMISPSGKTVLNQKTPFEMTVRSHRQVLTIMSFFIGEPGAYEIKASYREQGTEKWEECGSYELEIKHGKPPQGQIAEQ
jgi:hypothetical protein